MSKLDCVIEVLQKRMERGALDHVDPARDFVEADKMLRLENKLWILVELRYDESRGLTIERVSESREVEPNVPPFLDSFKDRTNDYESHPYLKGLMQLINRDIQNNCM